MPATSSRPSRKCNDEGKGNLSSPSSARASGSKKKRVDSHAVTHAPAPAPAPVPALKKKAVITTVAAAPAPVVEPAQKKKGVTPTTAAAPAPVVAPVVESPSKRSKDSGIVVVAGCAPVVSVAPSVETAPQKQANNNNNTRINRLNYCAEHFNFAYYRRHYAVITTERLPKTFLTS
jgi:hypothetical protein